MCLIQKTIWKEKKKMRNKKRKPRIISAIYQVTAMKVVREVPIIVPLKMIDIQR